MPNGTAKFGRDADKPEATATPGPHPVEREVLAKESPMKKVFVLGPNKCGTTSIHKFFEGNGLKSVHWEDGTLVRSMLSNKSAGLPILTGWTEYQCFSDLIHLNDEIYISPLAVADAIMREHPDDLYVFNIRDFEAWKRSREKHRKETDRPGILQRLETCFGGRYDPGLEYDAYVKLATTACVRGHTFRLEDNDKFDKLADFLIESGIAIEHRDEVRSNESRVRGRKKPALGKAILRRLQRP